MRRRRGCDFTSFLIGLLFWSFPLLSVSFLIQFFMWVILIGESLIFSVFLELSEACSPWGCAPCPYPGISHYPFKITPSLWALLSPHLPEFLLHSMYSFVTSRKICLFSVLVIPLQPPSRWYWGSVKAEVFVLFTNELPMPGIELDMEGNLRTYLLNGQILGLTVILLLCVLCPGPPVFLFTGNILQ